MTQPKRYKLSSNNKDTRWDRIRKRHFGNVSTNLKSDAVKKFIEIDYVGRRQQNILNGETSLETNLDPILVMNLRHEMFKKIPRKLPLATVAYSKNLQQCKDHNVAVENHYIKNQLNQLRNHLQKKREQNSLPVKKLHSLLVDNTVIMNSLESTQKHIEDFYNTPIDALQQVDDLFAGELEKHVNLIKEEIFSEREIDVENEHLKNNLQSWKDVDINLEEQRNGESKFYIEEDSNLKADVEKISLDSMREQMNEMNLNSETFDLQSEKYEERTSSPFENMDEIFNPLRKVPNDENAPHLRCVRFDEDINVCHLKREAAICSISSDGIDSVISDLAQEALNELQMADTTNFVESLEKNNLEINKRKEVSNPKECPLHMSNEANTDLPINGEVIPCAKSPVKVVVLNFTNSSDGMKEYSNREQPKIVGNSIQTNLKKNTSILRKYFCKWITYTALEKIERETVYVKSNRTRKINIFLNNLRFEKNSLSNSQKTSEFDKDHKSNEQRRETMKNVHLNKKYQNKIKVQQDIIDLQRLKLERQERIIMELKLHKLSEEAKEARQEIKNELKAVIRSGDAKSKAKAKCLQIIGNLKDEEDDRLNELRGKSLLMPRFLQNMQERALERNIRHEQVKQRRLQQEAEREAQKLALEEAKRLEDEEAKRLRMEALKEKRRQEKMAKIIKERERQQYIENQRKAEDFYKRLLLKRIGMEGFKRMLQRKRDIIKKCDELRRSLYRKAYFQAWFTLYSILKARRNQRADELHQKLLKRKYLQLWLQYVRKERSKFNVAVDYNDFKICEVVFRKWYAYVKRMKIIEETKMKQAILHHEWHLKWKVMDCWQRLPQILRLEKETEERRQRWRLKIWELLPDYKPNRDDF